MNEFISDTVYALECAFPHLHGAGYFLLGALTVALLFTVAFVVSRKRVHLLATFAALAYVLPFVR